MQDVSLVPFVLFGLFAFGLLGISAFLWLAAAVKWSSGRRLAEAFEPRWLPRWGFLEILLAFLCVVFLQIFAAVAWGLVARGRAPVNADQLNVSLQAWVMTIQSLAVVLITGWIVIRCGVSVARVGWSTKRIGYDIVLGLVAFLMFAPVMYGMMIVVTLASGIEYEHPLLKSVAGDWRALIPAIWAAVILAPLTEEFAFRVLLQGFLESMSVGRFSWSKLLLGRTAESSLVSSYETYPNSGLMEEPTESGPSVEGSVDPSSDPVGAVRYIDGGRDRLFAEPYFADPNLVKDELLKSDGISPNSESVAGPEVTRSVQLPWWPVVVSGVLFGLAHIGYGMSWIPLSVLGIVLGVLYRLTNRIWPSLVVHFCINAFSMTAFSLTVIFGDPTGVTP